MNHMPWDQGSIIDTLDQVLGFHLVNKTVKTMCNKRVSTSTANHKMPITCDICRQKLDENMASELRLMESLQRSETK